MTILSPDRVLQTSTTVGTVPYVLTPATAGFRNFAEAYNNSAVVPYCATDNQFGYEIGIGRLVYGTPDTIARTAILLSSNGNSVVNWQGTNKQVFAWDVEGSVYVATKSGPSYSAVLGDWGTSFVFTGNVFSTLTLPALALVPRGWAISLKNSGSAVWSIAVAGQTTDEIEASTSYSLPVGASLTVSSDGSVWRLIAQGTLDLMVGDSGSGGTKGLVPAPGSGDTAAAKFLKANGTWAVVPGASGITGLTTDVTATGPGSVAATIAANAVTNAKSAQMAAHTIKGNNTGSSANPLDLTVAQVTAELNAFVGDSGSGGTKGLVPAPSSGDAAANKFLKANGTFAVPPGAGTGTPVTIHTVGSGSSDSLTTLSTTRTQIIWNSNSGSAKSQTIPDPTLYDGHDVDLFDFFGDSATNGITVTSAGTGTITVATLGSVANLALQSAYGNLSFRAVAALNTWIVT